MEAYVRAFMNRWGDDDVDAKRSRPSIGKTREVPREERTRAFGPPCISSQLFSRAPTRHLQQVLVKATSNALGPRKVPRDIAGLRAYLARPSRASTRLADIGRRSDPCSPEQARRGPISLRYCGYISRYSLASRTFIRRCCNELSRSASGRSGKWPREYVRATYASEDRATAESIVFALRERGYTVFLDRDDLPPGESFDQQIERAINNSDIFVFLISPHSIVEGRYTLTELTFARRKWQNPNNRILPVMTRKTPREQVPSYLKAVTILEPQGNVAAETSAAVERMRLRNV